MRNILPARLSNFWDKAGSRASPTVTYNLPSLALDPGFADNGYMYVYHTYGKDGALFNRVVRLRLNGQRAVLDGIVLDGLPGDRNHNGGRLKIGLTRTLPTRSVKKMRPSGAIASSQGTFNRSATVSIS